MGISRMCKDKDDTQFQCTKNEFFPNIQVFWTQIQPNFNNALNTNWLIHEKIKSAFCKLDSSHLNGLIQFWAPENEDDKRILSTSAQPFSLEHLDSCFHKYRLRSTTCQYSIDVNNNIEAGDDDPMVITNGAPASVFRNHLPLVVYFKVHQGRCNSPLIRSVLKYKLTCLFLPVFYQSRSSSCVGVVECCMITGFGLLVIFNKLKTALESVGLTTFHAQESRSHSFKNIRGLKTTTDEIEEALAIACQSHHLTLAQVWISCLDETQTKPKFGVKLIGYYDDSIDENLKDYYDASDMLPLIIGEGLSGKTLQTYKPRFCRNVSELTDKGLLALLPENTQCGSLVICLRSLVTGDVNYAFEFLWTQNRNYLILLESLLLTLKRCLPSFKLASGAELGNELRVEDVENSTGRGIGFLKIPEVNRLSQLPKILEERRRLIAEDCMSSSEVKCKTNPIPLPQEEAEHQFGPFMNETLSACTSKRTRDVSGNSELQEPDFVKRKLSDECETQIESGQEDSSFLKIHASVCNRFLENTRHSASNSNSNSSVRYPVDDELIIRAEYGDQGTLLYLPISSTYVDIMKNIDEAYNLVPGSYALHYLDNQNQWIMLDDDEDWVNCLMHWRITGAQTIQVRLQEPTRRYPKIFNRNSLPQISKVLKKKSRLVKCISSSEVKSKNPLFPLPLADGKHFRRSANEAVGNLTVWQGPNFVKRKLSDLCESQSDSNQEDNDNEANQKLSAGSNSVWYTGDDNLIVNTEYGDHHSLLYLPISSKVADIKKNVDEKYKLDPNTFKLEFLDFEDKWIRLDYDRDWECCIKSSRTAGIQTIRMRVLLKH